MIGGTRPAPCLSHRLLILASGHGVTSCGFAYGTPWPRALTAALEASQLMVKIATPVRLEQL